MCYVLPSLHHHLLTRHRVQDGPLPISNESTYTSLDWATTKGKAVIRNYNADEDLQTEFFVRLLYFKHVPTPIREYMSIQGGCEISDQDWTLVFWALYSV